MNPAVPGHAAFSLARISPFASKRTYHAINSMARLPGEVLDILGVLDLGALKICCNVLRVLSACVDTDKLLREHGWRASLIRRLVGLAERYQRGKGRNRVLPSAYCSSRR
jgi:hypothetical protein